MHKTIQLTDAECQFLCDLLLRHRKLLADLLGTSEAEKCLRSIDKAQAYDIYRKIVQA